MFEDDDPDDDFDFLPNSLSAVSVASAGSSPKLTKFGNSHDAAAAFHSDGDEDDFLNRAAAAAEVGTSGSNRESGSTSSSSSAAPSASSGELTNPRRRRFPGPAGSFPRNKSACLSRSRMGNDEGVEQKKKPDVFHASTAWQEMLADRGFEESDPNALINRFNITWIMRKPIPGVPNKRSPVLACVLLRVDLGTDKPKGVLQDRSGQVQAVVDRKVIQEYGLYIQSGVVLLLKSVSVATYMGKQPFVKVGKDNLIALYSQRTDGTGIDRVIVMETSSEDLEALAKATEEHERRMLLAAESVKTPQSASVPSHPRFPAFPPPSLRPTNWVASKPAVFPRMPNRIPVSTAAVVAPSGVIAIGDSSANLTVNKFVFKRDLGKETTVDSLPAHELLDGLDEESLFGDF